jgi:cytochrome c-type biogenesis protein CcmE
MSITVKGTVQRSGMGAGTWVIMTEQGTTYEIHKGASKDLLKAGQQVQVTGNIREDVMTIAMVGPVLEVTHFESAK